MSTKLSGLASLSFIRGTRLCPPAKTFESLIFFSRDVASDTVVGEWSSKARGIMPVLLERRKSRYVFSADFALHGFFATTLFLSVPPILLEETSTTSPTFRNLSGFRFPSSSLLLESRAVPAHVPDVITSPGLSTTSAERYSTHSPNPLIMSFVFP